MPTSPFVDEARVLRMLRADARAGRPRHDALWSRAHDAGATERPDLRDGRWVQVTTTQLRESDRDDPLQLGVGWTTLARDHGLHPTTLAAFNHKKRRRKPDTPWTAPRLPELRAGRRIYIPSTDEVLFAQCARHVGGHLGVATTLYSRLARSHHLRLLHAGRLRASGRLGQAYANAGLDGVFLSPNRALAGASDEPGRWEVVNGQREYRIQWASDFWKCSVYLQDVVLHAGFTPHVTAHRHYLVAGAMQTSPHFREHPASQAAPGDIWQRFGGAGPEDSHIGILASFVDVRPLEGQTHNGQPLEVWTFSLLGAEEDGAGVSVRDQIILRGTRENTQGKTFHFFAPASDP